MNRPDGFLVATDREKEFVVENIKKVFTQANADDMVSYWDLCLRECGRGNIKR